MAENEGYIANWEEARRIEDVVIAYESNQPYSKGSNPQERRVVAQPIRYAQLTATLSAGTQASPTTCAAKFRIRAPGASALSDGDNFTVTNRSEATGISGDFCMVVWICGEWHVMGKDC